MHNFVFRQIGLKSPTGLKFQRGVPPIHKWILNILLNRLTVFARNVSPQSEQVQSTSVEKVQLWKIFSLLAISLGSLQSDQGAPGKLKKRMERDNLVDGSGTEFFPSTCGGNPLRVQVGTPDNKASRRTVSQISVQVIKELQILLELSLNRTKQMISVLRKGMEKKGSIASDSFGKLQQIEESIYPISIMLTRY